MKPSKRIEKPLNFAAVSILTIFVFLNLLTNFDKLDYIPNLFAQYKIQLLFILTLSTAFLCFLKFRRLALLGLAFVAIQLINLAPYIVLKTDKTIPISRKLRVVSFNSNLHNDQTSKVISFIKNSDADIVILQEVNSELEIKMGSQAQQFKYRFPESIVISDLNVFSKIPFKSEKLIQLGKGSRPMIATSVLIHGQEIAILAVHTSSPSTREGWIRQRQETKNICKNIPNRKMIVLAGDLNSTQWTDNFQELEKNSNLRDSSSGFGIQSTWPSHSAMVRMPIGGHYRRLNFPFVNQLLLIPIDQCLVSKEIKVLNRQAGPFLGSDHLPIIIDLDWE